MANNNNDTQGQNQNQENNSGNFANDKAKASAAGKEGAKNQPTEAKRKGGENSRRGSSG